MAASAAERDHVHWVADAVAKLSGRKSALRSVSVVRVVGLAGDARMTLIGLHHHHDGVGFVSRPVHPASHAMCGKIHKRLRDSRTSRIKLRAPPSAAAREVETVYRDPLFAVITE